MSIVALQTLFHRPPRTRFRLRFVPFLCTVLVIVSAHAARAAEPIDDFLGGLDALADGKFDQAAETLGKAVAAKPDEPVWQLDRGIALLMLGRNDDARSAFSMARKLDPQDSDVRIWTLARAMLYDPKPPPLQLPASVSPTTGPAGGSVGAPFDSSSPALALPTEAVTYSRKLLVAILGTKSASANERARAKAAIEDVAREVASEQRGGFDVAKLLYRAQRYRQALALIDPLLIKRPRDGVVWAYAGHCKLGLSDYAGAREQYTQALHLIPQAAGPLIGRARCEIELGSLQGAQADLALAGRVDDKSAAGLLAETEQLANKARANAPKAGELLLRSEQYTRELCRLELDIRDHPTDVAALLALVHFYLQPIAVCDLTLGGVPTRAKVYCWKMDSDQAAEVLARAVKLAPEEPQVLLEQARVYLAKDRPDDMLASAERALAKNAVDLDIAAAFLHFNSQAAKSKSAEAQTLRSRPGTWVWKSAGTTWIKVYQGPNADVFTRADELDRQAQALRANATHGLDVLRKQTAGSADPQAQALNHMADAYNDFWSGNLDRAIHAAEEAQALDPVNEHVLRFLILACGKANSPKAKQYKALRDDVVRY